MVRRRRREVCAPLHGSKRLRRPRRTRDGLIGLLSKHFHQPEMRCTGLYGCCKRSVCLSFFKLSRKFPIQLPSNFRLRQLSDVPHRAHSRTRRRQYTHVQHLGLLGHAGCRLIVP